VTARRVCPCCSTRIWFLETWAIPLLRHAAHALTPAGVSPLPPAGGRARFRHLAFPSWRLYCFAFGAASVYASSRRASFFKRLYRRAVGASPALCSTSATGRPCPWRTTGAKGVLPSGGKHDMAAGCTLSHVKRATRAAWRRRMKTIQRQGVGERSRRRLPLPSRRRVSLYPLFGRRGVTSFRRRQTLARGKVLC